NGTLSDWLHSRNSSPSSMRGSASPTNFTTRPGSMPVRWQNREMVRAVLLIRRLRAGAWGNMCHIWSRASRSGGLEPASPGSAAVAAALARHGTGRRRGFGRTARSPDHPARTSLSEQRLRVTRRNAGRGTAGEGLRGMLRGARSITGWRLARVCLLAGLVLIVLAAVSAGWAQQPHPWQLGMQPPATPVKERIHFLHNDILMPIITAITVFVLGLLGYVMFRFHHRRHPIPTRTSHNAVVEILWTVIPVLILVIIAIPSFKLMYYMDRAPDAEMTIKVTGKQWYWTYEYPDQGGLAFDSNIVEDKDLKPGQ